MLATRPTTRPIQSPRKAMPTTEQVRYDLAMREAAREKLTPFCQYVWPGYQTTPYRELMASALEKLERREITRLMIFAPPQLSGKSTLAMQFFPAWYMGRNPEHAQILCSYNTTLARRNSSEARNKISEPRYQNVFGTSSPFQNPVVLSSKSRSKEEWGLEFHRGRVKAAGVGAGITGFGAHCLSASALLTTNCGLLPIDDPNLLYSNVRVLSYDHANERLVWQRILAARELEADELIEITTTGGRTIECTTDHRFYIEGKGYVPADQLQEGDTFKAAQQTDVSGLWNTNRQGQQAVSSVLPQNSRNGAEETLLPRMWQREGLSEPDVPTMLLQEAQRPSNAELHPLWRGVQQNSIQPDESREAWCESPVLLEVVREPASVQGRSTPMYSVWGGDTQSKQAQEVLLEGVLGSIEASGTNRLRLVQETSSTAPQGAAVLRQTVCERVALIQDEAQVAGVLETRQNLPAPVQGNAPVDTGTRQEPLCSVQESPLTGDTSHQSEPHGQYARELDYSVQEMPHNTPRIEADTVSMVRYLHTGNVKVYDIQVAGTSNFFANGILTHNCLLIDDPVRSQREGDSELSKEEQWEWYWSSAYTRLSPDGVICITMTRWSVDDLAGQLLSAQADGGDLWHVLRLPFMAEKKAQVREWCDKSNITADRYLVASKVLKTYSADEDLEQEEESEYEGEDN